MNAFFGRRRTIIAARTAAEKPKEQAQEKPHEEIKVPEAPKEVPSFKGLKACPECGKEMTRGLYMHYMKKHKK